MKSVPAVVQSMGGLLARPGLFVFGSNDTSRQAEEPDEVLQEGAPPRARRAAAWADLRAAFTERGWLDVTHVHRELEVAGVRIDAAGVDDPPEA